MFSRRPRSFFIAAAALVLAANSAQAQNADTPAAIKALESQGLVITKEFKVTGGLRAFAGIAGDRPIAVYVTKDGNAIIGMRVDSNGEPLDEATLKTLAAKPISDKAWARLAATTWVRDGKADAPRIVYVFSDANCPYCHRFWEAARPWVDAGKVQLRNILVGIIKADSPAKAAAILGAPDRSAALQENERKFGQGGITPAKSIPASVSKILADDQRLMLSMGFSGTPGIVFLDGDGFIKKYDGMPRQSDLAEVLGPR